MCIMIHACDQWVIKGHRVTRWRRPAMPATLSSIRASLVVVISLFPALGESIENHGCRGRKPPRGEQRGGAEHHGDKVGRSSPVRHRFSVPYPFALSRFPFHPLHPLPLHHVPTARPSSWTQSHGARHGDCWKTILGSTNDDEGPFLLFSNNFSPFWIS